METANCFQKINTKHAFVPQNRARCEHYNRFRVIELPNLGW